MVSGHPAPARNRLRRFRRRGQTGIRQRRAHGRRAARADGALQHNYDDGAGLPAWVVAHPACTLATAQQVYWLCYPAAFYQDYGAPQNTPAGSIGYDIAQLIVAIEEKARSGGFVESPGQTAELRGDESIAEAIAYASLDKIPAALWQGLA
ncbi:DUF4274 domain-containing protein [Neisseria bacilliformis]|nr:DUF4274 domain-containing protein [Neisseria bacilliformis]QMT48417.1 DUF4274 domain-containing protein [Neisseria bacilliformis]